MDELHGVFIDLQACDDPRRSLPRDSGSLHRFVLPVCFLTLHRELTGCCKTDIPVGNRYAFIVQNYMFLIMRTVTILTNGYLVIRSYLLFLLFINDYDSE